MLRKFMLKSSELYKLWYKLKTCRNTFMTQNSHLLPYTKEGKTMIRNFSFLVTLFFVVFLCHKCYPFWLMLAFSQRLWMLGSYNLAWRLHMNRSTITISLMDLPWRSRSLEIIIFSAIIAGPVTLTFNVGH